MNIKGIGWLGTRTDCYDEMLMFFRDVLDLPLRTDSEGFAMFQLVNGDRVELFASTSQWNSHFTGAPVAGFVVENVNHARQELEARGVEFVHEGEDEVNGVAWAHFRAPDGNLYEVTHGPRE